MSLRVFASCSLARVCVRSLSRLTRSLAVEFVEKRKNELQDYLRTLLETPGLVHSPIILAFLEVPDSVRPMLAAAQHHQQQNGASQAAGGMGSEQNSSNSGSSSIASSAHKKQEREPAGGWVGGACMLIVRSCFLCVC